MAFVYQYVQLEEIEGHDADDLRDPLPIGFADAFAAYMLGGRRVYAVAARGKPRVALRA
jgi:hypothetical protein